MSLHPGNVYTEVTRRYPSLLRTAYTACQPLLRCVQPTLADGASTSVYVTACADTCPLRGAYYERSSPAPPAAVVRDEGVARQLYELAERLVKPWSAPL